MVLPASAGDRDGGELTVEARVRASFHDAGVSHVITVPCKYLADLLAALSTDGRFTLLYANREEEALAIAAGVHLAGVRAALLIQNSGIGNMINAYRSLCVYYDIPVCLLVSQRGDEHERVAAQVPMGRITRDLLDVIGFETTELACAQDIGKLETGLTRFTERRASVALIARKSFWVSCP